MKKFTVKMHSTTKTQFFGIVLLSFMLILIGCTSSQNNAPKNPLDLTYQRGRTVYQTQCTACHNSDPHKAGSIGPDVFGSSRELLEARVLRAQYPAGYQPKRETHQMAALPHLKNEIDALSTYLNK